MLTIKQYQYKGPVVECLSPPWWITLQFGKFNLYPYQYRIVCFIYGKLLQSIHNVRINRPLHWVLITPVQCSPSATLSAQHLQNDCVCPHSALSYWEWSKGVKWGTGWKWGPMNPRRRHHRDGLPGNSTLSRLLSLQSVPAGCTYCSFML